MSNKTLMTLLWVYVGIAFLFFLYEQPWNTKAWTDTDGVSKTGTAWTYVIAWPYAIFKQGTK